MKKQEKKLAIYQAKDGAIELRQDFNNENNVVWANLNQIVRLFNRDKSVISRHIKNIFNSGELVKSSTVVIFATVQKEGNRKITRDIEYFNLDVILSIGYRVDSKTATKFRKWVTKTLKQHITKGYTINIKLLAKNNTQIKSDDILELIKTFSSTWFSLESYDKQNFPKNGQIKKKIKINFEELSKNLYQEIKILKKATEFFAQEKLKNCIYCLL